jgi:hypothetical protein
LCASLSTRTSSSARGNDADDDERKTTTKDAHDCDECE